ncbi:MAG: Rod shape-determining protein MreB [Candidatus Uhrbacteria bacterium GW2011_GWE2_40_58]|nr:MAG: Rod shape-determining protein MreB [Candidatus Uhrbacteria bacterium GW2011_GWF2_40_263]KKR68235.1 MAG: Rod shape-determining protein MreB [Candidatus Uhrbacteria bacterium GW2011_GWE2_40_58]OGL94162.1 MAG: rod shape-determining protein [Candidatus Uhrbacteria bacterium RIFOXYA2_FULL_40_9]OGL97496.1 MAG: rod shape-determining protein [Candidatus Uhrbacteria bacterium RIFOXYB2_FULL_41_18]HBK35117.1 rod shape-determining protein [Candidatus Uhrbacteria bacterium]
MLNKFLGHFSKDLGIDLGTSNTLVYSKDGGIVINEPSVVAVNTRTDQILAVGIDAKDMLGKTPPHIQITKPLVKGVIADFEVTEKMLKYFIDRVHHESFTIVPRPRIVIGVPLETTEVERKAIEDAALSAGARQVFLIENPMLAALGSRLPLSESVGMMIVDIGGGTTEIAVMSLAGVVTWKSLGTAGDEMNKNIIQYARDVFNLLLGERVAEKVKIRIGTAMEEEEPLQMEMRGRDLLSGLPKEIIVSDTQIREALHRSISTIVEQVKATLERTPPELVADIYERGIIMTGGGSLLRGFDRLLAREAAIPVRIAEDPLTAVVRGAGMLLDNEPLLRDIALPSAHDSGIL